MTKLLGRTAAGKIVPVTVDDDGHLQIDGLSGFLLASDLNLDGSKDLQVDVKSITAGSNLIGRVDAREGDKIFSYHDQLFEKIFTLDAILGTNSLLGSVVPAGEIWNVTQVSFWNNSGSGNYAFVKAIFGADTLYVYSVPTYVIYIPQASPCDIYLKEGDKMSCDILNCSVGDDIYFTYAGYKMQI